MFLIMLKICWKGNVSTHIHDEHCEVFIDDNGQAYLEKKEKRHFSFNG